MFLSLKSFKKTRKFSAAAVLLSLLISLTTAVVGPSVLQSANATALATCAIGSSAQNSIAVEPSHPTVMYIDSGMNPRVDAAYVGYRISNRTGSTLKGYWASIDNFTGGVVSLANPLDKYMALPEIANNETKTVYFLVKATTSTKTAQAHDFKVWDEYPGAATAQNKYGCNFAFAKVAETIKASANKPTSTTVSSVGAIGTTFTVTSVGGSGTIGAGNPDVGRILWFTPAAYSTFPTRAFRLESVVLKVGTKSNFSTNGGDEVRFYKERTFVKTNTLADADASFSGEVLTADGLVGKRYYSNVYTFRVIDAATASIVPLAQISSGTQIKHSVIAAAGTGSIDSTASTLPATISKNLVSTSYSTFETPTISGVRYTAVPYKVTLNGTTSTSITADQVVDNPASGAIYKIGSTQVKVGAGSAAAYADPETFTAESSISPQPLHFIGPFTFSSSSAVEITYTMYIPSTAGTYTNSASAYIGDRRIISSTTASIPAVDVTVNGSGTVTGSSTTTKKLLPEPLTKLVSSLDTSTATLNGSINANDTTTAGYFEWGTSSSLASYTSVSLGSITGNTATAKSTNLSGLTEGTTYYYRIVAVSFGVRYEGAILDFRTLDQKATPTITTDAPSSVSLSDATLNATVDPNLTEVKVAFKIWRTNDTATVWVLDDPSLVENNVVNNADYNPRSLFSGASPTSLSIKMSDVATNLSSWIVAGATIYYRAEILGTAAGSSTIVATQTKQFTFASYNDQTIVIDPINDITWGASAPTESASATSGMTVTVTSLTTDVCTIDGSGNITIVKIGICTLAANQGGGLKSAGVYYNAAPEVTTSFTINARPITVTADAKTKAYGDSDPALTFSITSGSLVSPDTFPSAFTGSLTRAAGSNVGTYAITQNTLALGSNYSLTYAGADLTITKKSVTVKADSKSKAAGQSAPAFTYTLTGLVSPDSITAVTLTFTSASPSYDSTTAPTADGSYTITPSASVFGTGTINNYNISYETGTYVVSSKLAQSITWTSISTKIYGDTATATATASPSNLIVSISSLSPTICTVPAGAVSGATFTILKVGTCQLNASQSGNGTYAAATDVPYSFTVNPKPLTITATVSGANITYGDTAATKNYTNTALIGTDALSKVVLNFTSTPAGYSSESVPSAAGSYTLTPSGAEFSTDVISNYTISYETTTYTIAKRNVTVKADAQTKHYGESDPSLTKSITSGSLVGSDDFTGSLSRNSGETVGTYTINQNTLALNSNYNLTYQSENLTITTKAITVTAVAKTKVYGQSDPSLTKTYTPELEAGDSFSGALSRNSGENVGTYTITQGTLTLSSNYSIIYVADTLTVTAKPLTVKAESKTKSSTDPTPTFTYILTGLVSPDSITAVTINFPNGSGGLTTSAPTGDGSYDITPSGASFGTGSSSNYNITYETGTYTISSLPGQTLTWTTITTKIYGGAATATVVSNQGITPVVVTTLTTAVCTVPSSSVSGATVTLVGAGTCTLNASQAGNGSFAAATDATTSFTVNPKPITITATISASPKTYGDSSATKGHTVATLVSPDSISSVTLTFTSSSPSYSNVNVPTASGTYVLTPSAEVFETGTATNYTISWETATYVINAKSLTVTASSHTVTQGDSVPSITATYSDFAYSETSADLTGPISCTTTYTNSSAAGTYPTSCSGLSSNNYTLTYVDGSVTVNASGSPTTYTVTYNLNGGTGTTPTESSKTNGQTFLTATRSGFSRSGYTFDGWSCNSVTKAENVSVTVGTSNVVCMAIWTKNGNSNSPAVNNNAPVTPATVKKVAVANLVTIATTPVKSRISIVSPTSSPTPAATPKPSASPSPTPAATPKPSASPSPTPAATPKPSASPEPIPSSTPSPSASAMPSTSPSAEPSATPTQAATPKPSTSPEPNASSTPSPTQSATPQPSATPSSSPNNEKLVPEGITLSTTTVIPTSNSKAITFKGTGIAKVAVVNEEVSIAAKPGFSGKIVVTVTLKDDDEISVITADVLVLPLPVTNPVVKEVTEDKTRISWIRSPNAVGYEVVQNGEVLCTTKAVSCTLERAIPANPPVEIKALGKDQTESVVREATYVAAPEKIVPDIALVVNFDTNKYNIDSGDRLLIENFAIDVKLYGYKEVDISGHTDSRGGVDNNVLSLNRAKASRDYLLKLIPTLKVTINGYADVISVATNSTSVGMAANRRAEFRVVK